MILKTFSLFKCLWSTYAYNTRFVYFPSLVFLALFFNAGCSSIVGIHGYSPVDKKPEEIAIGKDTKASVLSDLGSPSTKSLFDDEIWYYISNQQSSIAFSKRREKNRKIVVVGFDLDGHVNLVNIYHLGDGNKLVFAKGKTPTRGKQLGVLEQLLGNIGRLPQGKNDTSPTGGR